MPSPTIYQRVKQLCPGVRYLEVRSRTLGPDDMVQFCCVTFVNEEKARTALQLLNGSLAGEQRLVARKWQERNRANDRRNGSHRTSDWNGLEKRRKERRGPTRYTQSELERLFVTATPGKWRTQFHAGSTLYKDGAPVGGFIEASGSDTRPGTKVCEVTRESDAQLISSSPELALQCLALLREMEGMLESRYKEAQRFAQAEAGRRRYKQRSRALKMLYAESLGQRLLLLASEKDPVQFRRTSKSQFMQEVRSLKRILGRRRVPRLVNGRSAGRNESDDGDRDA
jgi:hypothetical protein